MGSPTQLKAKIELNYRRGTTSKSGRDWNHFMSASEAFAAFPCDFSWINLHAGTLTSYQRNLRESRYHRMKNCFASLQPPTQTASRS
jgi:hypothetical protein